MRILLYAYDSTYMLVCTYARCLGVACAPVLTHTKDVVFSILAGISIVGAGHLSVACMHTNTPATLFSACWLTSALHVLDYQVRILSLQATGGAATDWLVGVQLK